MPIHDLGTHPARYVTVAQLAEYWAVSRRQILKRIESGALDAIRLGSRLYRIRTETALEFERRAAVSAADSAKTLSSATQIKTSIRHGQVKPPGTIGLRRVKASRGGRVPTKAEPDAKGERYRAPPTAARIVDDTQTAVDRAQRSVEHSG